MGFPPRQGKATPAQRLEVLRLHGQRRSVRSIAEEVFGDVRYRGRVQRIVAAETACSVAPEQGAVGLEGVSSLEAIRILHERPLAALLAGGVAPSMSEMPKLLDVQRRLDAFMQLERLRKRTRKPD